MHTAIRIGLMLALLAAAPADLADGPYVTRTPTGWTAATVDGNGHPHRAAVRGNRVTIAPVDGVLGFTVPLRPAPSPAAASEPLDPATPLLVLADTHGEYSILVALLRAQGIVDAKLSWTFGRGHLVIAGDMLDRGPHHTQILWLLYKLEGEAAKAGGRVHVVLGNHESMVVRGDLRYLNPRYPKAAASLGAKSYAELLAADTLLGGWLRSRPSILRLDDMLFLHGGISPALTASGLSLDTIAAGNRRALNLTKAVTDADPTLALLVGREGPLWYRGYFPLDDKPATATDAEIEASLERFGAKRIFVGHTIVDRVTPLFGGKVVAVQVYPERDKASGAPILEGALRLGGRWWRVTAQGQRVPLDLD
ncbi:metallophosphoesterase [Sphingoaurantiacus capsulatus]|uniref:Metallophosphoesterase n=1 Tax=Sphingoaurantiacus capsulatus TaxID=1771310 RepID=A0ABV7X4M4_9SPHN